MTATLETAVVKLEAALQGYRLRLATAQQERKRVEREYDHVVNYYRERIARTKNTVYIGHVGRLQIYTDRIETPDGTFALDEKVAATVDTSGNISVVRGRNLAAGIGSALIIGPIGLLNARAQSKTHDNRQLWLLVEHPDWAIVEPCGPEHELVVRQLAAQIPIQGRHAVDARETMQDVISPLTDEMAQAESDRAELDAAIAAERACLLDLAAVDTEADVLGELLKDEGNPRLRLSSKARLVARGHNALASAERAKAFAARSSGLSLGPH